MAECKHELKYLVGMADGIHCKACGAVLKEIPQAGDNKPAQKAATPKKGGRTNARK